ncbi:MAG: ribonuclease HII [Parachlamydiales bacterium]|jgi:ribonuclease HII
MLVQEQERIRALYAMEENLRTQGYARIAGVDEAGRGPLAGPVVAAVCCMTKHVHIEGINDSKQVPAPLRARLYAKLISHSHIHYAIGMASVEEIDEINIYQATRLAMRRAVEGLSFTPDYLLIDGMALQELQIPNQGVIKGDTLSYSIAAASIIAKEHRDQLMREFSFQWPHYKFGKNKGYGTAEHLQAIAEHGPCPIHRKSFEPIKGMSLLILNK